jgi:hypothetical protein
VSERPDPVKGYRCNTCTLMSTYPQDIADEYCGHCDVRHSGDIVVTNWDDVWDPGRPPVLRVPRIGCAVVAHGALGWCARCPKVNLGAEALAWRYRAGGYMIPGYTGAVLMSAELDQRVGGPR